MNKLMKSGIFFEGIIIGILIGYLILYIQFNLPFYPFLIGLICMVIIYIQWSEK